MRFRTVRSKEWFFPTSQPDFGPKHVKKTSQLMVGRQYILVTKQSRYRVKLVKGPYVDDLDRTCVDLKHVNKNITATWTISDLGLSAYTETNSTRWNPTNHLVRLS